MNLLHIYINKLLLSIKEVEISDQLWIKTIGFSGLFLLAIGISLGKFFQSLSLFIMLFAFLLNWKKTKYFIINDHIIKIIIIFLAYVWIRTVWNIFFVDTGDISPSIFLDDARKYSYIIFLPIIAWWFAASEKIIYYFFSVVTISLIFQILFLSNLSFDTMLQGRSTIGGNESLSALLLYYAFLCSVVIFWLIMFSDRITGLFNKNFTWIVFLKSIVWGFFLALVFIMLLTLEARASLFSLIIVLSFGALIILLRQLFFYKKKKILLGFYLLFFISTGSIALTVYTYKDYVSNRIFNEKTIFVELLAGKEIEDLQNSSIGIRLKLWKHGWGFFLENPIFGHGPSKIGTLVEETESFKSFVESPRHLHNSYIEILVSWGIFGFFLMGGIFTYIFYFLFYYRKKRKLSSKLFYFFIGAIIMLFINNTLLSFPVRQHGWIFMIIIMAPIYSFKIHYSKLHG